MARQRELIENTRMGWEFVIKHFEITRWDWVSTSKEGLAWHKRTFFDMYFKPCKDIWCQFLFCSVGLFGVRKAVEKFLRALSKTCPFRQESVATRFSLGGSLCEYWRRQKMGGCSFHVCLGDVLIICSMQQEWNLKIWLFRSVCEWKWG